MSRPFPPRQFPPRDFTRVNNKIRAREVRVIGDEGEQLGVMGLNEALAMARTRGVDLVEIAAAATPPVCRLVDYGKYRYEQSKKEKETKKHQHANKVKEIQLSANIDPHDFQVKLTHAIDFLCEDMKVKVSLRFRGREMAHQEFGFGQVNRFVKDVAPWGHPDAPPKLIGKGLNVMLSPLPRNKRAKHPNPEFVEASAESAETEKKTPPAKPEKPRIGTNAAEDNSFGQSPFASLDVNARK
ncbi:MAG TPA: translation initiation factor IF-3 [Candidatus Kapabacteria bacterium]|nr:translation initiation factor IF-3 [Candidatus Kapabacteria bacterium]